VRRKTKDAEATVRRKTKDAEATVRCKTKDAEATVRRKTKDAEAQGGPVFDTSACSSERMCNLLEKKCSSLSSHWSSTVDLKSSA